MHVEYDSFLECYVLVINGDEVILDAENHQDAVIEAKEIVGEYA
jgi:hypothetical protein